MEPTVLPRTGGELCRRPLRTAAQPINARQLTAIELVRECIDSRDGAAWLEFVSRFQPLIACVVAKTARRWIRPSPALVDDLVQTTYLKLCANNCKALRELDCGHENALFGFLKVVASHVVQDHFRSSSCQKRGSGKGEDNLESVSSTAGAIDPYVQDGEQRILIAQINQCLQNHASGPNSERDFAIFWLYYRQGFTAKEISELPGIDIGIKGVESTLLRLIRLVRAKLNRQPARVGVGERVN